MLPHIHRATQKFYIFLIVYLTGCTPKREPIPYICDFSRGGLNTRLHTLVSKLCSEAANIGDRLSFLADCGYWYKIRIHVRDLGILQNIMNL